MTIEEVRAVADAVLYEGYLLYPYRASSRKNRSRWQFGVLGPPHASAESFAESPDMSMECLLQQAQPSSGTVRLRLRFLQVQLRSVERAEADGYVPVDELVVDGRSLLSWEEATEHEVVLPPYFLGLVAEHGSLPVEETAVEVPGGEDAEPVLDAAGRLVGRVVRRRSPLSALVRVAAERDGPWLRLRVEVTNTHPGTPGDKDAAARVSLIGAHLVLKADGARFVSLLDPPPEAAEAASRCRQHRCWPVLAGPAGSADTVLGSPIILYDHPEIAPESAGALFDSTEIDEILTLRVMTMTAEEKAEARATDPRAAEIIERCDQMSPADLQKLHGVLRHPDQDPEETAVPAHGPRSEDVPWWDPAAEEVRPETDGVVIDGVTVARGSLVRVHPSRRADAQDLFFADRVARVTAVLSDVDGHTHVALVLADDPAADLHDWYGRYLYFAPEEIEPLGRQHREDSHP